MKVRASWEFDVDTEDFDPKHVDVPGLAIDLTKREFDDLVSKKDLSSEDLKFEVAELGDNKVIAEIHCLNNEVRNQIGDLLHDYFSGSKEYIDSDIVLNIGDDNMAYLIIGNNCNIPKEFYRKYADTEKDKFNK